MNVKFNSAANAYSSIANMKTGISAALPADESNDATNGLEFTKFLGDAINNSIKTGYKGESLSSSAVAGKAELHELVTAVTNTELTLQTIVAVRDRAVAAYQDILKMPI